jgi:pyruvyl transferase EpsO
MINNSNSQLMDELRDKIDRLKEYIPVDKNVIYIDYPLHNNIGDLLIYKGAELFLECNQYKIKRRYSYHDFYLAKGAISKEDMLIFHGGGNIGDLYPEHVDLLCKVINDFPDNQIFVFPQTIYFEKLINEVKFFDVMNKHNNLKICVRDIISLNTVNKYGVSGVLVPDMAHYLWGFLKGKDAENSLCFFRKDAEKGDISVDYSAEKSVDWFNSYSFLMRANLAIFYRIMNICYKLGLKFDISSYWNRKRDHLIDCGVSMINPFQVVVTNRLHAMILSLLLEKKVIAFDNSYGKLSSYYETWLSEHSDVDFRRV